MQYVQPVHTSAKHLRIKTFINYNNKNIYETGPTVYTGEKEIRSVVKTDCYGKKILHKEITYNTALNNKSSKLQKYTITDREKEYDTNIYLITLFIFNYAYTFAYIFNKTDIISEGCLFLKCYDKACKILELNNINLQNMSVVNPFLFQQHPVYNNIPAFDLDRFLNIINDFYPYEDREANDVVFNEEKLEEEQFDQMPLEEIIPEKEEKNNNEFDLFVKEHENLNIDEIIYS